MSDEHAPQSEEPKEQAQVAVVEESPQKKQETPEQSSEQSVSESQKPTKVSKAKRKPTKINRMVMHGFKSFAKHTEIPFSDGFNCVLGPNGSGKSNILDSLCFVLGKSSSKSLRAESSGNLVYNGGKTKQPAKQGEVSIYFDNESGLFPMDSKEVKLTRIVRANGQSKYRINDETKTRREVVELLTLAKIDPDGYNVILQGDIVRLVEMPPTERRLLIEDIAGISLYEEKKQKAIKELEKVEEHLKETDIVLAERESYLKELKKDRDQALKYKEMNDQVRKNKASYLKLRINRKEKEKEQFEEKESKESKEQQKLKEAMDKLQAQHKEKEDKLNDINKEIEDKGEVEQVELNKQVEAIKIDLTKSQTRIETVGHELEKLDQRKKDLHQNLEEVKSKVSQQEKEKKDTKEVIATKEKELNDVKNKIAEFKKKNNLDDIGNIEEQIEEIDKKSEEVQKQVHVLREKQHDLIRQKDKLGHQKAVIDDQMQKISNIQEEHKKQLDELQAKRKEFKKSTLELNTCLDKDSQISAQINRLKGKLQEATEDLSKLRAKTISIQESSRADMAIKHILDLKKPGIYGTLSNLGNVSATHSMALEVAAGHHMRSIVVEDDKLGAECIRHLKSKRLGTATFLPLNKVKPRDIKKELKALSKKPGVHGSAKELIEYDPKFENIFSFVFENTLVVDSIDIAVKLGVGSAKIVTLDGDLAERSGAMHGGFRAKRKQSIGFKEKELTKQLERSEKDVAESEAALSVHEKERTENEERITALRHHKATLEGEVIKLEKSLHVEDSDSDASLAKKKQLDLDEDGLDNSINEVTSKISQYNSELAQHKIKRQQLRATISQLNNPRLIAEMNAFEQKRHELNDEVVRLTTQLQHVDRLIQTVTKPEEEKTDEILKQLDKEKTQFQEEKKKLDEHIKQQKKDLSEKEKKAKEFYTKFKGLFGDANKLKDEISALTLSIEKKRQESTQIEIKMNTLSLKKAEFAAALSALNEEFAQYEGVELDLSKTEEDYKREIAKFERMKDTIGSVNMRALEIYDDVERQYNELVEKKTGLAKEREDVVSLMEEIEGKKKELFMETFNEVNNHFKEFFAKITTKGAAANLVIEDPENPFEAGVRINVKIGGSKFLDIRSLSGGEKTMTAIAFIFAIQEHDPATFYVLDEVDAALDKHNAEKLAKLIKEYCDRAQYIVISHNDNVISIADNLYGVSMNEHGVSQVVSLKV